MIQSTTRSVLAIALLLTLSAGAFAAGPATTPATYPAPHKIQVPAGYHVLKVGDRNIVCTAADDAWIKDAIGGVKPATRPTTMPADMLAASKANRDLLTRTMMSDLSVTDRKPIDDMFDHSINDILQKMESLKPPIYYFVISRPALSDLMNKGWEDPRFHYLRVANDVSYNGDIALYADRPMDDLVLWVETHDGDTAQQKKDALVTNVSNFDARFLQAQSQLSMQYVLNIFVNFVQENVMNSVKLQPGQQWFGAAVSYVYGIKYACVVTGMDRKTTTNIFIVVNQQNPVDAMSLDLIDNPLDPTQMIPQRKPYYDNAAARKGAFMVQMWLDKSGDGALAKTLPTLKAFPPNNTQDVVKDIKDSTGFEATPFLEPWRVQ